MFVCPFECIRVPLCALGAELESLVEGALKERLVALHLPLVVDMSVLVD